MTSKRQPDQGLVVHLAGAPALCAAQSVLAWQMTREVFARQKRLALPRKKREKQPQPRATAFTVTDY